MDINTNSNNTSMRDRPLIFLDLETTGLEVQKTEIIEIGALKTEAKKPFKVLGEISLKVKPKHLESADKSALKVIGFKEEEWAEAIEVEKALKILDEFGQDGVLLGYNVSFDWAVLDRYYFLGGRQDPFYYHRVDVMAMAFGKLFSKKVIKRFSLGEICKYLKIERAVSHRALDDAKATYEVFKKLMQA